MRCPHCDYWSTFKHGEGGCGKFLELRNVYAVKEADTRFEEEKDIFACPSCGKLFIETYYNDVHRRREEIDGEDDND